jgi:hypothetical protein
MESPLFLSELLTAHEPGREGRARSPSAPMRKHGALGEAALPRKSKGSYEAASSLWNCTWTMNQDGTALSQRDRAHLSWHLAQ